MASIIDLSEGFKQSPKAKEAYDRLKKAAAADVKNVCIGASFALASIPPGSQNSSNAILSWIFERFSGDFTSDLRMVLQHIADHYLDFVDETRKASGGGECWCPSTTTTKLVMVVALALAVVGASFGFAALYAPESAAGIISVSLLGSSACMVTTLGCYTLKQRFTKNQVVPVNSNPAVTAPVVSPMARGGAAKNPKAKPTPKPKPKPKAKPTTPKAKPNKAKKAKHP